jgi:hypothetical protein
MSLLRTRTARPCGRFRAREVVTDLCGCSRTAFPDVGVGPMRASILTEMCREGPGSRTLNGLNPKGIHVVALVA